MNKHFIAVFTPEAILQLPAQMFAWKPFAWIMLSVVTILSLASVVPDKSKIKLFGGHFTADPADGFKTIALTINAVIIFFAGYAIIQALGSDTFFRTITSDGIPAPSNIAKGFSLQHRVVALVGNPSLLGTYVAMCAPFSLYTIKNIWGKVGVASCIIILSLTQSATALVAVTISVLFYLTFRYGKKKLYWLIISCILSSLFAFTILNFNTIKEQYKRQDGFLNPTGRIEVHKEAWNIVKDRSLIGAGLGSFLELVGRNPEIYEKLHQQNWKELHNEYGQMWFETGLFSLIIFLGFVVTVLLLYLKNITPEATVLAASLLGFLVICLTLFPMRVEPFRFYGIVLTGLLLNTIRRN